MRQYYYKVDGCPAEYAVYPDCICWHNEGTGPLPDGYWINSKGEKCKLTWRETCNCPEVDGVRVTGSSCGAHGLEEGEL